MFLGKQFGWLDEATEIPVAVDYIDQLPRGTFVVNSIFYIYTESVGFLSAAKNTLALQGLKVL